MAVGDKHDRAGSRTELTEIVRGTLKTRGHGEGGTYDGTPKVLQTLYPPTLPRKSTPLTSRSHCWRLTPLSKQSVRVLYRGLIRYFRTLYLRTSRDAQPRCTRAVQADWQFVLPGDRLADMHHVAGAIFLLITSEICPKTDRVT